MSLTSYRAAPPRVKLLRVFENPCRAVGLSNALGADQFHPEAPEKRKQANARSARRMYQRRFALERAAAHIFEFYNGPEPACFGRAPGHSARLILSEAHSYVHDAMSAAADRHRVITTAAGMSFSVADQRKAKSRNAEGRASRRVKNWGLVLAFRSIAGSPTTVGVRLRIRTASVRNSAGYWRGLMAGINLPTRFLTRPMKVAAQANSAA